MNKDVQTYLTPTCPDLLLNDHQLWLSTLSDEVTHYLMNLVQEDCKQLMRAAIGSQFIRHIIANKIAIIQHWMSDNVLFSQTLSPEYITQEITSQCAQCDDQQALDKTLRQLRQRFMTLIIIQDMTLATFEQTAENMSVMAEACLHVVADFYYRTMIKRYGVPIGHNSKEPQPLLVIGMGKLGGYELNVSSDIDLLFAYVENGQTEGGKKSVDNATFFNRCGQGIINSLNKITADGFVFRVDMRLRPYGQSGSLTSSFSALEKYYLTQGREWERFAMVKARVVAATVFEQKQAIISNATEKLYELLQAFSYRQYIDFSIIESLRHLKELINHEVRRRDLIHDIKLGEGGIREIEFIVQTIQLIRGGREVELRTRNLLFTLDSLAMSEHIEPNDAITLKKAYIFLRNLEHVLQGYNDEQTQVMPTDTLAITRISWILGYSNSTDFTEQYHRYRQSVHKLFNDMIAKSEPVKAPDKKSQTLWKDSEQDITTTSLNGQNNSGDEYLRRHYLYQFRRRHVVASLNDVAKEQLDQVMPLLLSEVESPELLERLLNWVAAIAGRSIYLSLLLENQNIIQLLVTLFDASVWVSEQLTQSPSLLDELLNEEQLLLLPSKAKLKDELRQQLLRVDEHDLESQMETLRYFKLAHSLKAAASEITGQRDLMKTSDYLTYLAEVILDEVLTIAWFELAKRYGEPLGEFIMVGYGKLGGIEMSYSSDLDLVFIYEVAEGTMTQGERSIDSHKFYTRLGQKVIHLLTTRMSSGELYDVDMRLRPSGSSGLLVTTLNAFIRYQEKEAWIWEHQALVRARTVAGSQPLAEKFINLRTSILQKKRELSVLSQEVKSMREKMRKHLDKSDQTTNFDLKHGIGGIVDIEFMVQYAVLAWAHKAPSLTMYTDNIRILECLSAVEQISEDDKQFLISAYQSYRAKAHKLALYQHTAVVKLELFAQERARVLSIWTSLLSE